ncbi:hypothetical protein QQ045_000023 [Rhodiola kirilowii]
MTKRGHDVVVKCEVVFHLTLFYGNPRVQDRVCSWNPQRQLKKELSVPWVVVGDLNEIAHSWEMSSTRGREMWQMRNFKECLVDCGLSDLNYKGESFTYTNRRKGEQEVRARLDRAMANHKCRELFRRQ